MKDIKRPGTIQETANLLHVAEFLLAQTLEAVDAVVEGTPGAAPEPISTKVRLLKDRLLEVQRVFELDTIGVAREAACLAVCAERFSTLESQCGTDHETGNYPADCLRCAEDFPRQRVP
jgi:hypothetical protein